MTKQVICQNGHSNWYTYPTSGQRTCRTCSSARKKTWREKYPERHIAACRKWEKDNPEAVTANRKFGWLARVYGVTLDQYHALFEKQGECCALCGNVLQALGAGTHLDHDHKTGKVRGLLCSGCNQGLGSFRDNVRALRRAADYVEKG